MHRLFLIVSFLFSLASAQAHLFSSKQLESMLLPVTDPSFGGVYLKIEEVMRLTGASRFEAHEIQNHMRDALEANTLGFSYTAQRPWAQEALQSAISAILTEGQRPSGFRPLRFSEGEFVVVLDMDETLLVQWYEAGNTAAGKGTFTVSVRDSAPMFVDRKTKNSVEQPRLRMSSPHVLIRPGVEEFLQSIEMLPGFQGFVLFTAKEDRAAEDLVGIWKQQQPKLFENVLGLFTRNHLVYRRELKKPSKDLRIFDPSLEHVVLIDDNDSRVVQKGLNHRILKFGADPYLKARKRQDQARIKVHSHLLEFVGLRLSRCVRNAQIERLNTSLSACFRSELGGLERSDAQERQDYRSYLRNRGIVDVPGLQSIDFQHEFHQPWVLDLELPLHQAYPHFVDGRMQTER